MACVVRGAPGGLGFLLSVELVSGRCSVIIELVGAHSPWCSATACNTARLRVFNSCGNDLAVICVAFDGQLSSTPFVTRIFQKKFFLGS